MHKKSLSTQRWILQRGPRFAATLRDVLVGHLLLVTGLPRKEESHNLGTNSRCSLPGGRWVRLAGTLGHYSLLFQPIHGGSVRAGTDISCITLRGLKG
jgi:hypothetical protein